MATTIHVTDKTKKALDAIKAQHRRPTSTELEMLVTNYAKELNIPIPQTNNTNNSIPESQA